jgi:tetratricopeptide (TPR) repeat protein
MAKPSLTDDAAQARMAVSAPSLSDRFANKPCLLAGLLALVTLVAYQPVWHAGFIWDDDDHLTANPAMTAPHGLRMIWSSLAVSRYYPLTLTSFWFQRRLWGLSPRPYHLVNVALHAVNGVLLYFVLRRLRIRAAWLAAMLWVLHPVNVESAAWVTELKNTQSGALFFLAVLCFLRSERPAAGEKSAGDSRRYTGLLGIPPYKTAGECGWYALSLVCGLAAMLSKPSTVILPVALLLCVWWERGGRGDGNSDRESRAGRGAGATNGGGCAGDSARYNAADEPAARPYQRQYNCAGDSVDDTRAGSARYTSRKRGGWRWADLRRIAPFLVLALGMSAVTVIEQHGNVLRGGTTEWKLSMAERLVIATKAVWFYAGKVFWPAPLMFVYAHWTVEAGSLSSWAAPAGLIVVGIVLWRRRETWVRAALFGIGFFVAALSPVLAFFDVYYFRFSYVADHFQYLASIGLIAVVASGVAVVCDRAGRPGRQIGAVAGPIILLSLAALTWRQARIYRDSETLWRDTLAKNPRCWLAASNLGYELMEQGRLPEAKERCEQALQIKPDNCRAHDNLGAVLIKLGRLQEAMGQCNQALQIDPQDAEAHYDLGMALVQLGRLPEAIAHYGQALRVKPDDAEVHNNLALALARTGRVQEAITHWEQALRLKPDYAEPHDNLGVTLARMGRLHEAVGQYEQALQIDPQDAEAHDNLGIALVQLGRVPEAIGQYEQALRVKPDDAEVYNNLALALARQGRLPEAIEQWDQAIRVKPDDAAVHNNLGIALVQLGRLPEAVGHWEQALRIKPDYSDAHYNLGVALERGGRVQEAIQHYEEALRLKPDSVQAQNALARARAAP